MARNDAPTMAKASALRSQRRRLAGEHAWTEAQIADAFGSEWGLDWAARRHLEHALLAARKQPRGGAR